MTRSQITCKCSAEELLKAPAAWPAPAPCRRPPCRCVQKSGGWAGRQPDAPVCMELCSTLGGMHQSLSLLLCGQDMMTEQEAGTASMILYMILHTRCPSAWAQMRCDESFHVCLPVSSTEWGHTSPCLPEVPGQNKQTNLAAQNSAWQPSAHLSLSPCGLGSLCEKKHCVATHLGSLEAIHTHFSTS